MRFSALSLLAALLTALGSAGSGESRSRSGRYAHDREGHRRLRRQAESGLLAARGGVTIVAGPQGTAGRLEVIVPDGDQVPVVYRDRDRGQINLAAGQRQTLLLYAKSGPVDVPFAIRFTTAAGGQWTRDLPSLETF